MKRVFLILMAVMLLFALVLPCVAADSLTVIDDVEDEVIADDEDGGVDVITDFWNWLMSHKDDIMAMILLVAAALYKWGSGAIKKHIIPELEKQGAKVVDMASAAGKITLTNKDNFEQVMNEVKEVIKEGNEREQVFLEAVRVCNDTKDQYAALCGELRAQNEALGSALMAQEQMIYETLMSAKLTDARKAEVEAQHLKLKDTYEALLKRENGGEADASVGS